MFFSIHKENEYSPFVFLSIYKKVKIVFLLKCPISPAVVILACLSVKQILLCASWSWKHFLDGPCIV